MTLLSVSCNHCGAPLQITEETKFVTCLHCDHQLAVKHSDSAIFTGVILYTIYSHWTKHETLTTRERQYHDKRAELVRAMDHARQR